MSHASDETAGTLLLDEILATSRDTTASTESSLVSLDLDAPLPALPDLEMLDLQASPQSSEVGPIRRRRRRNAVAPHAAVPVPEVPPPPPAAKGLGRGVGENGAQQAEAQEHQQSQNWFGTISHLEGRVSPGVYNPEDVQLYLNWEVPLHLRGVEIECAAWQPERGARGGDQGFLHIQIYLKAVRPHLRYAQLNAFFGFETYQARWFVVRSPPHAWDYCQKADTRLANAIPRSFGDRPLTREQLRAKRQAERADAYISAINEKTPMTQLLTGPLRGGLLRDLNVYLQMRSYLDQPSMDFIPKLIYWIYGPTNSDKTYVMNDFLRRTNLPFWKSQGTVPGQFFPGYDFQPIAVFEEVRQWSTVSDFLLAMDGMETRQPLKLSSHYVIFRAKVIIVTSEHPPARVGFKGNHTDRFSPPTEAELSQITRRIKKLPIARPGEDGANYPWRNHPKGSIIHFNRRENLPWRPPKLPVLQNAHRRSLKLPLITAEEEARQIAEVDAYNRTATEVLDDEGEPWGGEDQELLEARRNLHAANAQQFAYENLLDDDEGRPEPRGRST